VRPTKELVTSKLINLEEIAVSNAGGNSGAENYKTKLRDFIHLLLIDLSRKTI